MDALPSDIPQSAFEDFLPPEMARKGEEIGIRKANLDFISMFALAVLAGAFISLGAIFATVTWTNPIVDIPWGWGRAIGGLVFSLGLILVIVGGAELFTGNNLIVMAWASRRLSTKKLLHNWGVVYLGNIVGALATAGVVFLGKHYQMADGAIGMTALNIGLAKVRLDFLQAVMLGILGNALVCLAVWLTYSARNTIGRVAAIVFPISAFVAAGFEHCIANMYFIPFAILIKVGAPDTFWQAVGASPASYQDLTWGSFFLRNLLPVTIGNMIGGVFFVAAVYWSVYLHRK
jgi:formate transporter